MHKHYERGKREGERRGREEMREEAAKRLEGMILMVNAAELLSIDWPSDGDERKAWELFKRNGARAIRALPAERQDETTSPADGGKETESEDQPEEQA